MNEGDKVICVKDYITDDGRLLFSKGEISFIKERDIRLWELERNIIYVDDILLMMEEKNELEITDFVGDLYFINLKESRKKKLEKLNTI
jgi:hypothetical protein